MSEFDFLFGFRLALPWIRPSKIDWGSFSLIFALSILLRCIVPIEPSKLKHWHNFVIEFVLTISLRMRELISSQVSGYGLDRVLMSVFHYISEVFNKEPRSRLWLNCSLGWRLLLDCTQIVDLDVIWKLRNWPVLAHFEVGVLVVEYPRREIDFFLFVDSFQVFQLRQEIILLSLLRPFLEVLGILF